MASTIAQGAWQPRMPQGAWFPGAVTTVDYALAGSAPLEFGMTGALDAPVLQNPLAGVAALEFSMTGDLGEPELPNALSGAAPLELGMTGALDEPVLLNPLAGEAPLLFDMTGELSAPVLQNPLAGEMPLLFDAEGEATIDYGVFLTDASDLCLMADGTLWVGRWSAAGLSQLILQEVESYTEAPIGSIGPRAVYKLSNAMRADGPTVPAGTYPGVLSLHPSGYALVQVDATTLALWERGEGGAWTAVAWGEVELGRGANPEGGNTPGFSSVGPGRYRLEVFANDLWALTFSGGRRALVRRGSALVQTVPPSSSQYRSDSLPMAVAESYNVAGGVLVEGQTTAYEGQARWREAWWQGPDTMRRYGNGGPWFKLLHSSFPHSIMADEAAVYGAGSHSEAFGVFGPDSDDWPTVLPEGSKAGEWARFDGLRLQRADVDCLPLTGRTTAGALWLLGADAAALFALANWGNWGDNARFVVNASLLVPTAIYRLGAPDPTEGVAVWGSSDSAHDGWYVLYDGAGTSAVYLHESGLYVIIYAEGGTWVIVALPDVTVTGAGDDAYNQVYSPGGMMGGYPYWVSEDGDYWLMWCPELGAWVLIPADTTCADALYYDGSGVWPNDTWYAVDDPYPPTVTMGEYGEILEVDGTGEYPWEWPVPPVPPGEGEVVLFTTQTDAAGRLAVAVRLTLGGGLAAEEGLRAIVRATADDADPTDYTTYQACPFSANVLLGEPGLIVRVAVIGPGGDPPDVNLQVMRFSE